MNGAYGEGPLAFHRLFEMLWKCMEVGAWLFIGAAALWFLWLLWRRA